MSLLVVLAFGACAPVTIEESRAAPGVELQIKRMLIISPVRDAMGHASFFIDMDRAYRQAAARCGIHVAVRETPGSRPPSADFYDGVAPEAVLALTLVVDYRHRTTFSSPISHHWGGQYVATLTDLSTRRDVWTARFEAFFGSVPPGSPRAAILPDMLFERMIKDGVLRGCRPAG